MSKIQIWLAQTRANFLLLAVFLVLIGLAYAAKYSPGEAFNWWHAILIMAGTISAHISVNLFNELSDFHTGIDHMTRRTPFSGGSGMLTAGNTRPGQVKMAAIMTLLFSAGIGVYFTLTAHFAIALISILGALTIMFYTNYLSRYMLGEFFAGLALGTMVVIGAYIAMNGAPGTALTALVPMEVCLISIPPGILTFLLLLLNEFPDVEADQKGGRKHLVIRFGKKTAAKIYAAGIFATFAIILALPIFQIASYWLFLALLPLPAAIKAAQTAIKHAENTEKLMPAMGLNVMVVLATDLLIALSVIVQL